MNSPPEVVQDVELNLPDHLLISMQVDAFVRSHWPWLAPLCLVACLGAVALRTHARGSGPARWRLRTAMIAVALVALAMCGLRLWGRSLAYRMEAVHHANSINYWNSLILRSKDSVTDCLRTLEDTKSRVRAILEDRRGGVYPEDFRRSMEQIVADGAAYANREIARIVKRAEWQAQEAAYHDGMERKYLRAASHPWEPVPPDPQTPGEMPWVIP